MMKSLFRKNIPKLFNRSISSFGTVQAQVTYPLFQITDKQGVYIVEQNRVGLLSDILKIFNKEDVDLTYIEANLMNKQNSSEKAEFRIYYKSTYSEEKLNTLKQRLALRFSEVRTLSPNVVPWFPRYMSDLDYLGKFQQTRESQEAKDHPQFSVYFAIIYQYIQQQDPEYKKRRDYIASEIPICEYNDIENKTWQKIYNKLLPLQDQVMCSAFLKNRKILEKECNLCAEKIPQLKDLSNYLQKTTGFRLKPVHGILSQREFLNSLAFRTFCCTQYIRHHSTPEYTPEPDIVHELLGHIPMFVDPEFADLSQIIGIYSLGANEDQLERLGALYWFTVEYGACQEDGSIKGYGAGIASSIGELEHFQKEGIQFKKFDPIRELPLNYPIQTLQPTYQYSESFAKAKETLQEYGEYLVKPFRALYNANKQEIEVDRPIITRISQEKGLTF